MDITGEQMLEVFAAYNLQIWPMQILAYVLGLIVLYLGFRKSALASRVIPAILAFFWLWVAFLFWLPSSLQGFTIGFLFTAIFAIEGILFLIQVVKPQLAFGTYSKPHTMVGVILMLYALIGYPLVGLLIGHRYPRTPPFGLTPCPLIIFNFGLLLLTQKKSAEGSTRHTLFLFAVRDLMDLERYLGGYWAGVERIDWRLPDLAA